MVKSTLSYVLVDHWVGNARSQIQILYSTFVDDEASPYDNDEINQMIDT